MIVGTPVVATYAGGTADMVKDCATLVQDGDPYVMAGAIVQLISDFDAAKAKSIKGRELAQNRHNPSSVSKELITAYRTILE